LNHDQYLDALCPSAKEPPKDKKKGRRLSLEGSSSNSKKLLSKVRAHGNRTVITALAMSSDGKKFVFGSLNSDEAVKTFPLYFCRVFSITKDDDAEEAFFSETETEQNKGMKKMITSISFNKEGSLLAAAGGDQIKIFLWANIEDDPTELQCAGWEGLDGEIKSISFYSLGTQQGHILACSSNKKSVYTFKVEKKKDTQTAGPGAETAIKTVEAADNASNKQGREDDSEAESEMANLAVTSEGAGQEEGTNSCSLSETPKGAEEQKESDPGGVNNVMMETSLMLKGDYEDVTNSLAILPDERVQASDGALLNPGGLLLATAGDAGEIRLHLIHHGSMSGSSQRPNGADTTPAATLTEQRKNLGDTLVFYIKVGMRVVTLSATGSKLAYGGGKKTVVMEFKIFPEPARFQENAWVYVQFLTQHCRPKRTSMNKCKKHSHQAEGPSGTSAGHKKQAVRADWNELFTLDCNDEVNSVALSGDGQRVLVGSFDRTAKLYCCKTGALLQTVTRGNRVNVVAMNEDGAIGCVGDFDGAAVRYALDSGLEQYNWETPAEQSNSLKRSNAQAVAISGNGKSLFIGSYGKVLVYDLFDSPEYPKMDVERENVLVYCGDLTYDGSICFAGGYDKLVIAYHVEDGSQLCKILHDGFIWDISMPKVCANEWNTDTKTFQDGSTTFLLAVGSWDNTAKIYEMDFGKCDTSKSVDEIDASKMKVMRFIGKQQSQPLPFSLKENFDEFKDRVFSVDLSGDETILAVGTRDQNVHVYSLEDKKEICHFLRNDRVYSVALSNDSQMLAVGDVDKKVAVYDLQSNQELYSWQRGGLIHSVKWTPNMNKVLIAGGEDGVELYDVALGGRKLLQLRLNGVCWSLAVCASTGIFALTSGPKVEVVGEPRHGFGPRDRPSFGMLKRFIEDEDHESLQIVIDSHPSAVNACSSTERNRISLLQFAVENNNVEAVRILINGAEPCALIEDLDSNSPLSVAAKGKQKQMVELLFHGLASGKILNSPGSLSCLFEVVTVDQDLNVINDPADNSNKKKNQELKTIFEVIGFHFPDVLLDFLEKLSLEECEKYVIGDLSQAPVQHDILIGLPLRSPRHFWEHFFAKQQENHHHQDTQPIGSNKLVSDSNKADGNTNMDISRTETQTKQDKKKETGTHDVDYAITAFRVPFPGICKYFEYPNGDGTKRVSNRSPLQVIVEACQQTENYSIFNEGSIATLVVDYKWLSLRRYFLAQGAMYLVYLILAGFLATCMTNSRGVDGDIKDLWQQGWGKAGVILAFIIMLATLFFIIEEFKQLRNFSKDGKTYRGCEGVFRNLLHAANLYFSAPWNTLDAFSFVLQMTSCIMFLARAPGYRGVQAVAILLLFFKVLFFARGFKKIGTLVRMIDRTMASMRYFLLVVITMVIGFSMAFRILQSDDPQFRTFLLSLIATSLMIYGEFDSLNEAEDSEDEGELTDAYSNILTVILFEVMLILVFIIMLNLLIAIMNDTYSDVKTHSINEYRTQLAWIILELEKGPLRSIFDRKLGDVRLYAEWLHVLRPKNTLEPDPRPFWQDPVVAEVEGKVRALLAAERRGRLEPLLHRLLNDVGRLEAKIEHKGNQQPPTPSIHRSLNKSLKSIDERRPSDNSWGRSNSAFNLKNPK